MKSRENAKTAEMNIRHRPSNAGDLQVILDFIEKKDWFPSYIGFEEPAVVRKVVRETLWENSEILENHPLCKVFLTHDENTGKPLGYLALMVGVTESITGEAQSMIYDYYVEPSPFKEKIMEDYLAVSEKLTLEAGYRYIITDIYTTLPDIEEFFRHHGYGVEMNRLVKKVEPYSFDSPRQKKYRVRNATGSDRSFIMMLNAQHSSLLIPPGRAADEKDIQESYLNTYFRMDLENDPFIRTYIAEDVTKYLPVGYIMIKLANIDAVSGLPLAYIYDVNIHRDYWGKYVFQRLIKEAQNRLYAQGVKYIIGDTSITNPRPTKTGVKTMGFQIYSRRWMKRIR